MCLGHRFSTEDGDSEGGDKGVLYSSVNGIYVLNKESNFPNKKMY